MENRITKLFHRKDKVLSLFNTAGFPRLNDTVAVCQELEKAGVDMIELGFPFSDPIADGPTIQQSNTIALKNGMNLKLLFQQLQSLRDHVSVPVLLMGYLNPVLRFGIENFCIKCAEVGIDGVILPDLPFTEYQNKYAQLFTSLQLSNIFLVTQRTSPQRIREIDAASHGFIYAVSTSSVTGIQLQVEQAQQQYFERLRNMELRNPFVVGFGISSKETFDNVTHYANGGIIASAFIRELMKNDDITTTVPEFVHRILIGV